MSGGFFRGTSADQDTRFSNKQAKLLKSQKFASELDHLVDMTKVKMDVLRPWIATRVTELLGFEDEVLINFIYGLLDGKIIDGKQIQIQLTGFMEKNTGKFMKELWILLLSAQKNASGIPQQFLDAKEEETRKKKAETERITHEIQKKKEKEGREFELERQKKMDAEADLSRAINTASDAISKRDTNAFSEKEREADERNGSRGKNRISRSPHSASHSLSPNRKPSPSRSSNKSFSRSRSYSGERQKSRSISGSPPRRHSISPERRRHSLHRRSISPHRRDSISPRRRHSISPHRRHSPRNRRRSPSRRSPHPHLKRRSVSRSRNRSPSPRRHRSPPIRRRSPTSLRRRSPFPFRRRSPPFRRRSPSPYRRRSPSPRWRSPIPPRQLSSSPLSRSPPVRSPRHRKRSPRRSPSPLYTKNRSLSRDHGRHNNGVESRRSRDDYPSQSSRGKRSPARNALKRKEVERSGSGRKEAEARQSPISLRSPQRDPRDKPDAGHKGPMLIRSPSSPESPPRRQKITRTEDRRIHNPSESPARQTRGQAIRHDSPETSREEEEMRNSRGSASPRVDPLRKRVTHSPKIASRKRSPMEDSDWAGESPERLTAMHSAEDLGHPDKTGLRKKDHAQRSSPRMDLPEKRSRRASQVSKGIEYGPGRLDRENSLDQVHDERLTAKHLGTYSSFKNERLTSGQVHLKKSYSRENSKHPISSNDEHTDNHELDAEQKYSKNIDQDIGEDSYDLDSDVSRSQFKDKRKEKRSEKKYKRTDGHLDDDEAYDSQMDERKEAKRRRKEEKKLRKEEKRRRREERHRKRDERRAGKLKAKAIDTVTPPPDVERNQNDDGHSDGDGAERRHSLPSDSEETESEQKRLEIELRKKALESLRAKKAISH